MIKKLILLSLVSLSFQSQAKTSDKHVIEAGKPSIIQASKPKANQLVLAVVFLTH